MYAQQMIDEYRSAGVKPRRVWAQSFNIADVEVGGRDGEDGRGLGHATFSHAGRDEAIEKAFACVGMNRPSILTFVEHSSLISAVLPGSLEALGLQQFLGVRR